MRNKIVVVLVLMVTVFGSLFTAPAVHAADFEVSLKTTVSVTDFEKFASVDTILEIENKAAAETPNSIAVPVYGVNVKGISAKYEDNNGSISTTYDETNQTIALETNRSYKGKGNKWSLKLSYSTDLVNEMGDSHLILLSPTPDQISGLDVVSEQRELLLDLNLGAATRLGAKTPTSGVAIGQQILTWKESSNIAYATGVVYGDSALASVQVNTTLENNSWWWKDFTVVLPPDTNQQRVVIDNIEPKPRNVRVDIDGNVLLEYRLRPRASMEVSASAKVLVNNYTYAMNKAQDTISDQELAGLSSYVKKSGRWTPITIELDTSLPTLVLVNDIAEGIRNLDPTKYGENEFDQNINMNDKFVGTLRDFNIPARVVRGVVFEDQQSVPRAWAEVYISGLGWITVDSMGETQGFVTADARYVALLIRSSNDSWPPSRLKDTTVAYVEGSELPEVEGEPVLSTTTYMILPGVGLRIASVDMPGGPIVDNAAFKYIGDRTTLLGSLAPYQTMVSRDLVFGSYALSSQEVLYGTIDSEGELIEAAKILSDVSWLPFIVEIVILILAIAMFFYVRKRGWPKIKLPWRRKKSREPKAEKVAKPKKEKKKLFSRKKKEVTKTEQPEFKMPEVSDPVSVTTEPRPVSPTTMPDPGHPVRRTTSRTTTVTRKPRNKLVQ